VARFFCSDALPRWPSNHTTTTRHRPDPPLTPLFRTTPPTQGPHCSENRTPRTDTIMPPLPTEVPHASPGAARDAPRMIKRAPGNGVQETTVWGRHANQSYQKKTTSLPPPPRRGRDAKQHHHHARVQCLCRSVLCVRRVPLFASPSHDGISPSRKTVNNNYHHHRHRHALCRDLSPCLWSGEGCPPLCSLTTVYATCFAQRQAPSPPCMGNAMRKRSC
jgi:hypothetical protein